MDKQTFTDFINHINDKIFKLTFQQKATAVEYLETYVSDVATQIDLEALTLKDTNFVAEGLEEYFCDVVYETHLKPIEKDKYDNLVRILLLFEHKKGIESYFDLFLQLLSYIVMVWKQDRKEGRKPTVVLPLVINQSTRKIKDKSLHDSLKFIPKYLLKYVPQFSAHIVNVHSEAIEKLLKLREDGILRSLFLSYIAIEDKNKINAALVEIFKFIATQPQLLDYFEQLFVFLTQEGYFEQGEIKEMLHIYLSEEKRKDMLTTAQVWKKEGFDEGVLLGEERGIQIGKEHGIQIGEQRGIQIGEQIGEQLGERQKARLTILRGLFRKQKATLLADLSELPLEEVKTLARGFRAVKLAWKKQKVDLETLKTMTDFNEKEILSVLKWLESQQ